MSAAAHGPSWCIAAPTTGGCLTRMVMQHIMLHCVLLCNEANVGRHLVVQPVGERNPLGLLGYSGCLFERTLQWPHTHRDGDSVAFVSARSPIQADVVSSNTSVRTQSRAAGANTTQHAWQAGPTMCALCMSLSLPTQTSQHALQYAYLYPHTFTEVQEIVLRLGNTHGAHTHTHVSKTENCTCAPNQHQCTQPSRTHRQCASLQDAIRAHAQ